MMAGNPNWWSMNNSMHPQPFQHQLSINPQQYHQFVYGSSNIVTSSADSAAADDHNPCQDYPVRSLSQLLLFGSEEDRYGGAGPFQPLKKLENWEDQVLNDVNPYDNSLTRSVIDDDVKQEHQLIPQSSMCQQLNDHSNHDAQQYSCSSTVRSCNNNTSSTWRAHLQQQLMPVVSSPTSCVTTLNTGFLDLSAGGKKVTNKGQHQHNQDHSSECNSTSTGGVAKKVKVQQSSAQPAMKVRKEKLGDRITALHQIVSPFGKTDTASVLSEAIGYIRFLHGQIEALSAPYIRNASAASSTSHHLHSHELGDELVVLKDLRSRGLCLVPVSCTQNVCNNNDSGADYWAPAAFGGGGF